MIVERNTFSIGETASLTKKIDEEDILAFARISGDTNPVHTDADYAKNTYFKGKIAHGMLVASLISSVLGNTLPGPGSIYLSQELKFKAPVRPGDVITVQVSVINWDPSTGRIGMQTDVVNQEGTIVMTGQARLVMAKFLSG